MIWKKILLKIVFLVCFLALLLSGYFGFKVFQLQKKITNFQPQQGEVKNETLSTSLLKTAQNLVKKEKLPLKGEKSGRINFLLLGMGGEGHKGKYLTDSIILASVNVQTGQLALLSIPRDLYVEIPHSNGLYTKINALYAYEMKNKEVDEDPFSSIKEAVKEVTGQEVHYFAALDFEGFKKIINELGGIDIEVEEDIYDPRYPGPNYSYTIFELKKGFHHLDAETSLKYARVRHTKGGDFARAARQQKVLQAVQKKAFQLKIILNPIKINNLIDILGENLKTNVQLEEIPSFIELAKNTNFHQITTRVLDAWSENALLASTHVPMGGVSAYVLLPRIQNYSQIHFLAENIFSMDKIEKRKEEIEKEAAKILAFAPAKNLIKIKSSLGKIGYAKIEVLSNNQSQKFCPPNPPETILFSKNPSQFLFTLDDLAEKLDGRTAQKGEYPQKENYFEKFDIIVCVSQNLSSYIEQQLSSPEDQSEQEKDFPSDSILDDEGRVITNKKH